MSHRYSELNSIGGAGGATATYTFSCNGMFDPNITGTGHQPMFFDQMSAIYDHYTVFRSTIRLEVTTDLICNFAFYIDDDTSSVSTVEAGQEQPSAIGGLLTVYQQKPRVLTLSWDGKKFFGGDLFDNDNLQGSAAANPTEQSYFTFKVQAANALSTPIIYMRAVIDYYAVWDELKTQTQS